MKTLTSDQNQGGTDVLPVSVSTTGTTTDLLAPSTSSDAPKQIISSSTFDSLAPSTSSDAPKQTISNSSPLTKEITGNLPTQQDIKMTQESKQISSDFSSHIPKFKGNRTLWYNVTYCFFISNYTLHAP